MDIGRIFDRFAHNAGRRKSLTRETREKITLEVQKDILSVQDSNRLQLFIHSEEGDCLIKGVEKA